MKSSTAIASLILFSLPSLVLAQDGDEIPRFEDVTVETVRPDEVPELERSGIESVLLRKATSLPTPPTTKELDALGDRARPLVLHLATLSMPPKPYRQQAMVFHGHATWLSAKDDASEPLLVTTSDWLVGAESILVLPSDPKQPRGGISVAARARIVSLSTMTPGDEAKRLERRKKDLVELVVVHSDPLRNLAVLAPAERGSLERPAAGFSVFDFRANPVGLLYGVSPAAAELLTPTDLGPRPAHEALQYYMTTSFSGLHGAPLVSPDGATIGLTSGLVPGANGVSLVIPPGALSSFVSRFQGVPDPNAIDEKKKKQNEEDDESPSSETRR